MSKCPECEKDMLDKNVKSCTHKYILIKGKWYKRNTTYFDVNDVCHDCGIENKRGNTHHFGCDIERCPRCKGQMISCNCEESYELSIYKPKSKPDFVVGKNGDIYIENKKLADALIKENETFINKDILSKSRGIRNEHKLHK